MVRFTTDLGRATGWKLIDGLNFATETELWGSA